MSALSVKCPVSDHYYIFIDKMYQNSTWQHHMLLSYMIFDHFYVYNSNVSLSEICFEFGNPWDNEKPQSLTWAHIGHCRLLAQHVYCIHFLVNDVSSHGHCGLNDKFVYILGRPRTFIGIYCGWVHTKTITVEVWGIGQNSHGRGWKWD